ncbi:hypothetical protein [Cerasicoccus frondis]|uniref:hypothetical protein n=1 Tax=Cerasicoccus frondis TaxID=490090 RepID=UPI00285249EA|nr:hypothetical protein [Cerasicoccus frondis]
MMDRVFWAFGISNYSSYEKFIADVSENCERIASGNHDWDPDAYVCNGPLKIEFELMWKDPPDDMLYFDITEGSEKVTQGILLFRLNNASFEYFKTDHHKFFEGLGEYKNGTMYLDTGS